MKKPTRTQIDKRVRRVAKQFLKELSVVKTVVLHFDSGLYPELCDNIESLLDRKTQVCIYDDYSILVVTFKQKPKLNEKVKRLINGVADLEDCPSQWYDEYEVLVEYPDELVSKSWVAVHDRIKGIKKLENIKTY